MIVTALIAGVKIWNFSRGHFIDSIDYLLNCQGNPSTILLIPLLPRNGIQGIDK